MSIDFNKIFCLSFKSQVGINDFIKKKSKCLIEERDFFAKMLCGVKFKQDELAMKTNL